MSCRIERNNEGKIETVKTRYGQESPLFKEMNSLINDGMNEDLAYAAYLKATNDAANIGILQEPALVNNIVQKVLMDVNNNFDKWNNISKELKFAEANQQLQNDLFYFLDKIGVRVETVDTLKNDKGETINATGLADLTNRTIQLVTGKADMSTLTEETVHFIVEVLRADNNPLFKSMYNMIEGYNEYKEVANPDGFYYKKYNGDIDLLKREAIAKVITKHLINGDVANESKEKVSRLERWWQRVLNMLSKMFGKVQTDPFTEAALGVVNRSLENVMKSDPAGIDVSGVFYQEDLSKSILDQLDEDSKNYINKEITIDKVTNDDLKRHWKKIAGDDPTINRYVAISGPYKGKELKFRGSDRTAELFKQRYVGYKSDSEKELDMHNQNIRMAMGTKGHLIMEDLIDYHFEGKGSINAIIQGVGSMMKAEHVNRLSLAMKSLKKTIDEQQKAINKQNGTKGKYVVRKEQFIADEKNQVGGTIDMLVVYSDGSASIYDYKFKSSNAQYSKESRGRLSITGDMFASSLEGYDSQIGHYKDALLSKYGVTRVRQSRIIPVAVRYESTDGRLSNSLTALEVYVDPSILSKKDAKNQIEALDGTTLDWLRPIPVAQETTDDKQVNNLIESEMRRYKKLVMQRKNAPFADRAALDEVINESLAMIRALQHNKDISIGLTNIFKIVRVAEAGIGVHDEFITENGEKVLNPKYLSEKQLREVYGELIHFQAYTTLNDVSNKIKKSKTKNSKELVKKLESASFSIGTTIKALEEFMVDRMDIKSKEKGITNFRYNRVQSKVNTYINVSQQSNPYSRYVTNVMNKVNGAKVKFEAKLAAEIEAQDALLKEYAQENGMSLREVFEKKILNPSTHNLYAKYKNEFYEIKNDRIEKGDHLWMKRHHTINLERFNRDFPEWQKREYNRIEQHFGPTNKAGIKAAKAKWNKRYDLINSNQAWLDAGKYWLNINEETTQQYITDEYKEIQSDSRLKSYYDYHVSKIKEFGDKFGKNLGNTYVAWVNKSSVDAILEGSNKVDSFKASITDRFKAKGHDVNTLYGMIDDKGNPIRHIPRIFTTPLTEKDEFGNDKVIPQLKSTELSRSLYLLGQSAFEYEQKREIEDELLLIELILQEGLINEIAEDKKGNAIKKAFGQVHNVFNTAQTNAQNFTDVIDNALYGRNLKDKDVIVGDDISLVKTGLTLKNYASIGALGLKTPVAIGAGAAGIIGVHIQGSKGLHFNNKQVASAEAAIIKRDPKVRAIMEHFQLAVLDVSKRRGEMLSSNYRAKFMTGDRWFEFLAQADLMVDTILAVAMAKNHGIDSEGNLKRLSELPDGTKSIYDSIEVTDNEKYTFSGAQNKYFVNVPNETENSFNSLRARHSIISNKIKGTASPEAINTAGMKLINRFFLHYRSWLPGLALERFGITRYDHILEHFDQGTWRGFFGNFGPDAEFDNMGDLVKAEFALTEFLGAALVDIGKITLDIGTFGLTNAHTIKEGKAQQEFELFLADRTEDADFDFKGDPAKREAAFQKFLEMKRGNLRGALAELRAVILLGLTVMGLGGDWDDDGKIDIRQSWLGRKTYNILNRVYRETAVFWDPTEFVGPRSTGIPLLGLIQDGIKLLNNSADELGDRLTGKQGIEHDPIEAGYYTFKLAPGLGALAKAMEIYPQHKHSKT